MQPADRPVDNVPFEALDPEQQAIFLEAMHRSGLDPEKFRAPAQPSQPCGDTLAVNRPIHD